MNYGLTKRESQLFHYIKRRIEHGGVAPSFDEMRSYMGLTSKATVFNMVNAIERRGLIRRRDREARAIKLVHWTCPHCGGKIASVA